ncbi:MAG TPA: hypothetical protein VMH92_11760 [Acidocella sp.]|nr:hypothetical protein [Acidocella sp.]
MDDPEFSRCFDVLQKSGENFRSNIYGFVLIYGALLIWSLNAYVYPAEQNRIQPLQTDEVNIIKCLQETDSEVDNDKNCKKELAEHSIYFNTNHLIKNDKSGLSEEDLKKIDIDIYSGRLKRQHDKAAEIAEFHIPIAGIVSDRSWLWLINCTIGLFFYQIFRDQLTNIHRLLSFLASRTNGSATNRILLLTVQVVTSSGITLGGRRNHTKLPIIGFILLLPIFCSVLSIYDWHYFIFNLSSDKESVKKILWINVNSHFLQEPEFYGGFFAFFVLLFELRLFTDIIRLLYKLFRLNETIQQEDRSPEIPATEFS